MLKKRVLLIASLVAISFSPLVNAVENDDFEQTMILADATRQNFKEAKQKYRNMTPAQRKEFDANVKKKWDSMSAEDKQKFKNLMKDNAETLKLKAQNKNKSADDESVFIRIFGYEELNK